MKTMVVLLLFLCSLLASASSGFKETRYLYALDKNISLEGYITFGAQNIVIEYVKPESKVLTYFEEKLTIQGQNGYTMVDAQALFKLFFYDYQSGAWWKQPFIEFFFDTTTKGNQTLLSPKGITAEVLEEVHIERHNKQLKALHVKIKNGDRISIEIVD